MKDLLNIATKIFPIAVIAMWGFIVSKNFNAIKITVNLHFLDFL